MKQPSRTTFQLSAIAAVFLVGLSFGPVSAFAASGARVGEPDYTPTASPTSTPSSSDGTSESTAQNPPDDDMGKPLKGNTPPTSSGATTSAAGDGSFSSADAVKYAVYYACNRNNSCRNSFFKANTDDCANFVSQALYSAGLKMDGTWYYLNVGAGKISTSWGKAPDLANWLDAHHGNFVSLDSKLSNGNVGAPDGSVIEYNWGNGEGWSHVALVTGTGTYANYYDPVLKDNYRNLTAYSSGTRITQHTTDRDGAPWNLGYWTYPISWKASAHARYIHPS